MRFSQWIALLTMSITAVAFADDIQCRVVGISDGDTFTCLVASRTQIKVRMGNIDTPESAQPYGQKAKRELSSLLFGKTITLKTEGKDRYGRVIGYAYADGLDANREMVARGAAWVYRQYNRDPSLLDVEKAAREARLGLWRLPESDIVPPWEWRKSGKQLGGIVSERKTVAATGSGHACGEKRYCGQMNSCAEAKFYLQQCGVASLDRDRDGVPCENICHQQK